MHLNELLALRGLPANSKVKLVRHEHAPYDMRQLHDEGHFEFYQRHQSEELFKGCDYVVALLGEGRTRARFVGVYKVGAVEGPREWQAPGGFPYPAMPVGQYRYELNQLEGFDDLKDRLIVDWGAGTRQWHQWLKPGAPKEVVELLPAGYVREFPGYDDFILTMSGLQKMVGNPTTYREWQRALSAVAGVYLVTTKEGQQYVGSAAGTEGIWGRWKAYASDGHAGNTQLKTLLAERPGSAQGLSFTLLRILPRALSSAEVLKCEQLYKRKLGTRAYGLNGS